MPFLATSAASSNQHYGVPRHNETWATDIALADTQFLNQQRGAVQNNYIYYVASYGVWRYDITQPLRRSTLILVAANLQRVVLFNNQVWAIASSLSYIKSSTDDFTWTTVSNPLFVGNVDVVNNILFMWDTTQIAYRAASGSTFTTASFVAGSPAFNSGPTGSYAPLRYLADGYYIAAQSGILYSSNLSSWSLISVNSTQGMRDIVDNGSNIRVAVSSEFGGQPAYYSISGGAWTRATLDNAAFSLQYTAYFNGIFVLYGDSGVYTSTDGINFTRRLTSANATNFLEQRGGVYCYGNSSSTYYSSDLISWNTTFLYGGFIFLYIAGTFNRYVLIGLYGGIATPSSLGAASTHLLPAVGSLSSVSNINDGYVGRRTGSATLSTSTTGRDQGSLFSPSPVSSFASLPTSYLNNRYISRDTTNIYTSNDRVNYTTITNPIGVSAPSNFSAVAQGIKAQQVANGIYLGGGFNNSGRVLRSTDAITFTGVDTLGASTGSVTMVLYTTGNIWYASGVRAVGNSLLLRSTDNGLTWVGFGTHTASFTAGDIYWNGTTVVVTGYNFPASYYVFDEASLTGVVYTSPSAFLDSVVAFSGYWFISGSSGLFRTSSLSGTWTSLGSNFGSTIYLQVSGSTLFVFTTTSTFQSSDGVNFVRISLTGALTPAPSASVLLGDSQIIEGGNSPTFPLLSVTPSTTNDSGLPAIASSLTYDIPAALPFGTATFNAPVFVGGLWFITQSVASSQVAVSADAQTWATLTLTTSQLWADPVWNGSYWLFGPRGPIGSGSNIANRYDGNNVTQITLTGSPVWWPPVWNGSYWLFVPVTPSFNAANRYDGTTVTAVTLTTSQFWQSPIWNGSYWLIGPNSDFGGTSNIANRYDGTTVSAVTLSATQEWFPPVWNGSYWLFGPSFMSSNVANRYDGTTVSAVTLPASQFWSAPVWNGSYWLFGPSLNTSSNIAARYDGTTVSTVTLTTSQSWWDPVWNGSYWLFGPSATSSNIVNRYDGTTVTSVTLTAAQLWWGPVWNNSYWLFGPNPGATSSIANQYDGTTVTAVALTANQIFAAPLWNGSYWLFGPYDTVASNTANRYDGNTVTPVRLSTTQAWNPPVWNGAYWLFTAAPGNNTNSVSRYG